MRLVAIWLWVVGIFTKALRAAVKCADVVSIEVVHSRLAVRRTIAVSGSRGLSRRAIMPVATRASFLRPEYAKCSPFRHVGAGASSDRCEMACSACSTAASRITLAERNPGQRTKGIGFVDIQAQWPCARWLLAIITCCWDRGQQAEVPTIRNGLDALHERRANSRVQLRSHARKKCGPFRHRPRSPSGLMPQSSLIGFPRIQILWRLAQRALQLRIGEWPGR